VQELILKEICGTERPNLCVVGDDDQGLYRFRGASIRNILEFRNNFPADICREVTLTTNYRSHPDIIGLYNQWMTSCDWEFNGKTFRLEKKIAPYDGEFPETPTVLKITSDANTDDSYHAEVLAFLRMLKERAGLTDWNQVAFLFYSVRNEKVVSLARFL